MVLRPLFPFQQAQYAQVFPLKPALFCMLFAGLGSTNKSAISLLLFDSRSFLLSQTLWQIWQKLSSLPVLSDYNESRDTRFFWGMTRLMSWPDGERYLRPLQSLVVSLIFRIHSFSYWRRTVSTKFFDTQIPSISIEELVLPRHARCVLSSTL